MDISNVTGFISSITWIISFGALVFLLVRALGGHPLKGNIRILFVALIMAIVFSTVSAGVVFINGSERGVVISPLAPKGYRADVLEPGLHMVVPFFDTVKTYSVAKQTYTMAKAANEGQVKGDDSIMCRTADGQQVFIDASVIFKINPAKVLELHLQWQDRYTEGLVRPLANGIIRDSISQYGVEQVYSSRRSDLTSNITKQLQARMEENGLFLDDFILRNITFTQEFSDAVEQKQVAQQMAAQAKFVVDQKFQGAEQERQVAKGEADAMVIRARGEAESHLIAAEAEAKSVTMLATVLNGIPNMLTYQYISKLSPSIQTMLVPNNTNFLLQMPGPAAPNVTMPQADSQPYVAPTLSPDLLAPTPTPEPTLTPTPVPTTTNPGFLPTKQPTP